MSKITLKSSQFLFNYGLLFAITPLQTRHACAKKAYPLFLILGNIFLLAVALYARLHHFKLIEPTTFALATMADCILVACNLLAIITVNFQNYNKCQGILDDLSKTEFEDNARNGKVSSGLMSIAVTHCAWAIYIGCNLAVIIPSLSWYVKYFLLRELQNYHLILTTLVMTRYVIIIEENFKYLNEQMQVEQNGINQLDTIMIRNTHFKLTQIIGQFNTIYGQYFILLYIYIIVNLLVPMNVAAVYAGGQFIANGHSFGTYLPAICLVWTILPIIIFRNVFKCCEAVSNEVGKMPENCYRLIINLEGTNSMALMKNDLSDLLRQIEFSKPVFSANGWFDINYGMILPTITMIISYLIVLIQYHD